MNFQKRGCRLISIFRLLPQNKHIHQSSALSSACSFLWDMLIIQASGFVLATTVVRTFIYFKGLCIPRLLLCYCLHMPQLPPVMAHIIMFIFKHFIFHVVILPEIFSICTGFPLFMVLKLDITGNVIAFQVHEVFPTAVAVVSRYLLQNLPKSVPVFSRTGIRVL